ncbi:cobalamin biosynthesis protein CobD [Corticibacter populi]|uniref:Cobalamin biosynthesis protein CobD n=1 Tax=Corticibacter populi TaxID=1550736 RepID=A0A3M6QTJ9_9BURK|nr:cobalamin biosynthesis protein CobD [Corticibacter populi]RZS32123.1 adenosylcobinamide-phosphate synthase [Corticibacter populi]
MPTLPDEGHLALVLLPGLGLWLAMVLALLLDRWPGEPPAALHPVVWMGRTLALAQRLVFGKPAAHAASPAHAAVVPTVPARPAWLLFTLGALAWLLLAAGWMALAVLAARLLQPVPWWGQALLLAVLLKPMLAWRMLRSESLQVEAALQRSLGEGRRQLARLVSRDVTLLDAGQVRESAVETLAENFNDSVVAPLFWFLLLGLPGAVLYRFANTADAMWGYPGWRGGYHWQWAGKWAARADDVLSWLPARLTAAMLLLANSGLGHWQTLRRQAGLTPSPNGGWPMAAMALLLGCRLGKPGVYVLNAGAAEPGPDAVAQASRCARRALLLGLAVALLPALPIGAWS